MNDIRLPKNIPLFPLPGVLLLPGGILPLHIFEQRYLTMFRDALQGDSIIGMVQPSANQPYHTNTPIYTTGCAGEITQHQETEDGRMLVTLRGLCRFDIIREHDDERLDRTAEVDYLPSGNTSRDESLAAKHQRLLNAASLYLPSPEEHTPLEPLLEASISELVTVLAMHCPFSATEKQSLLEAPNLHVRTDRLIELLEQSALDN